MNDLIDFVVDMLGLVALAVVAGLFFRLFLWAAGF